MNNKPTLEKSIKHSHFHISNGCTLISTWYNLILYPNEHLQHKVTCNRQYLLSVFEIPLKLKTNKLYETCR